LPAPSDVELQVSNGKGGRFVDEVEVAAFEPATGGSQRTTLVNALGDAEGAAVGRRAPGPGTRYAMPLTVVYKPSDPTQAIALVDARESASDRETPAVGLGMVAVGVTVAAFTGVHLDFNARRRGRRWWSWHAGRHRTR
jgi:hypothetical protein